MDKWKTNHPHNHHFCKHSWFSNSDWNKNSDIKMHPRLNLYFFIEEGFYDWHYISRISSWTWQLMGFLSAYYYSWDVSHIFPHFSIDLQGDIFTHYGGLYTAKREWCEDMRTSGDNDETMENRRGEKCKCAKCANVWFDDI